MRIYTTRPSSRVKYLVILLVGVGALAIARRSEASTIAVFSESFDGVAAPGLPIGWTTTTTGAGVAWVTNTSLPVSSAPNTAFAPDPSSVSTSSLITPIIAMPSGTNPALSFLGRWALETGFDGGVLEISVNGGAFQDILAAGGSFVTGGYNGTISVNFSNPIAGRQAWTGSFNTAFTATNVMLPAGVSGQNIQLRWRLGTDTSVSGSGWRLDDVAVTTDVATVPEPATLVLLGAGIAARAATGRRRRRERAPVGLI
jgi:hypothetical protein